MTIASNFGPYSISVPFKGQRDYIQGPDLVEASLNLFDGWKITGARFSSHSFIQSTKCVVNILERSSEIVVPFKGQVNTDHGSFWVTIEPAGNDELDELRVPFDERKVTDFCHISDDTISHTGSFRFTLTETIVSMKKALLQTRYPDVEGQWIFTSVDYKALPETIKEISVKIDHNFQHKLVKSSILVDGKKIGLLYFSLIQS